MKITNKSASGRSIPALGIEVQRGETVDVDPKVWTEAKKHPVVASWLESGELVEGENAPTETPAPKAKKAPAPVKDAE